MSDESRIAALEARLAAVERDRIEDRKDWDAAKARYDGHIQNVVKAIVVAALLVLWKPFADFWQAVQGAGK